MLTHLINSSLAQHRYKWLHIKRSVGNCGCGLTYVFPCPVAPGPPSKELTTPFSRESHPLPPKGSGENADSRRGAGNFREEPRAPGSARQWGTSNTPTLTLTHTDGSRSRGTDAHWKNLQWPDLDELQHIKQNSVVYKPKYKANVHMPTVI